MGKSDMFAVRGVTPEMRKMAKAAAAWAGVTLGAWLNMAIEKIALAQEKGVVELRFVKAPKTAETVANKDGVAVEGEANHAAEFPPITVENVRTMREQLTGEKTAPAPGFEARGIDSLLPPVTPTRRGKKKAVKVCAHGTAAGYNCWKCGGLVRVE